MFDTFILLSDQYIITYSKCLIIENETDKRIAPASPGLCLLYIIRMRVITGNIFREVKTMKLESLSIAERCAIIFEMVFGKPCDSPVLEKLNTQENLNAPIKPFTV